MIINGKKKKKKKKGKKKKKKNKGRKKQEDDLTINNQGNKTILLDKNSAINLHTQKIVA